MNGAKLAFLYGKLAFNYIQVYIHVFIMKYCRKSVYF